MADAALPLHRSRGPLMLGVQWTSFSLATLVVLPRLLERGFCSKNLGWDDATIFLSWIIGVWNSVGVTKAVQYGFGKHLVYVADVRPVLYWSTPTEILAIPAFGLVKVSICIFVLRLLGKTHKRVSLMIWINLGILIPVSIGCMFGFIFQCIPLSAVWDELFPPDKCMDRKYIDDITILFTAVTVFTDCLTISIPIMIISRLQMSRRNKALICVLIALGFLVTGISIYKLVDGVHNFSAPDSTYALIPVAICASLEHHLGMFVACLPALGGLFMRSKHSLSKLRVPRMKRKNRALSKDLRQGSESWESKTTTDSTTTTSNSNLFNRKAQIEITRTVDITLEEQGLDLNFDSQPPLGVDGGYSCLVVAPPAATTT